MECREGGLEVALAVAPKKSNAREKGEEGGWRKEEKGKEHKREKNHFTS